MSNNIVIYTKPEILLHKMGMFPNPNDDEDMAFGKDLDFFWVLNNAPDNIKKVYFATKGYIIGYFQVERQEDEEIEWNSSTWTLLEEPIPTTHFQGFKYARNIPELIDFGEEKEVSGNSSQS